MPSARASKAMSAAAARLPEHFPLALRTGLGLAALAVGASAVGAAVVTAVMLWLSPIASLLVGRDRTVMIALGSSYVGLSMVLGVAAGVALQRRTVRWVLLGRVPSPDEATRALRLPTDLTLLVAVLWLAGALLMGGVALARGGPELAARIAASVVIGGLATSGITYQLAVTATRPLVALVLRSTEPSKVLGSGLLPRLLLTWSLTVGVQLLGALVLLLDAPSPRQRFGVAALVGIALVTGGISTALVARTLGAPLRRLRDVVRRVAQDDLEVDVVIDDAGEIGLLQSGVREMISGLRERDRITDLFGRHVGPAVAKEALRTGVTLEGERRRAVALFVDITGSTALARQVSAEELVGTLNRFFTIVVDAVEAEGGLVNKFEGDAALCVFGAPVTLADAAGSALRAGRQIRRAVEAAGEVDVGIGIAAGEVVAGQVGARSRLEYTVIGDAVNAAARLTDLAKDAASRVLATAETVAQAAAEEQEHWATYGEHVLRGRGVPTVVCALRS